ncbi:MAG: cyclase family protein [Gemmatimonadetes bacterium]|nr:cyclase family protein [Gemmatimonadota bacterium]
MAAIVCVLTVAACVPDGAEIDLLFQSPSAWIDLSHPFDAETIYWPTAEAFRLDTVADGITEGGYYYAAYNFTAAEHGGTHLDAPAHFAEGRDTPAQIPLARLIGPAVVVDVSDKASADQDYLVSVADFTAFEAAHGPIGDGVILLLRTGWGRRWPDAEAYLGTALRGPDAVPLLHFPGLAPEAARWLVDNRSIGAIGIDTPSIDFGQSTMFETHQILYGENIPGFENVANLEAMPETGGYVVALPMKIAGGSGGPLRMVGVVPGR